MNKKLITNLTPVARVGMSSIYRMSDAPPNWSQDDPTQPDYIKNKEEAEKLRPIYINGEQILDDTHESGPLNLVEGDNVELVAEGNNVIISAKSVAPTDPTPEEYRPIQVEGQEVLGLENSGALNLKGGKNVELYVDGNDVYITATGGGSEGPGGECDCAEIIEGEGIDIVDTPYGQKIVSLEKGAITDDYIDSISVSKLVQSEDEILILNGGKANGYNY
jgi:antitoxin component of MazEF toxin-antitoxin module